MHFMVAPSSNAPKSLGNSIRSLRDFSAGFVHSWLDLRYDDAIATSEKAFEALDHIQNEFLRRRDDLKHENKWFDSQLRHVLSSNIGILIQPVDESLKKAFCGSEIGYPELPVDVKKSELTLEIALNKLKHRASNTINFSIKKYKHTLYIFTHSGMRQDQSISVFEMGEFCNLCRAALEILEAQN